MSTTTGKTDAVTGWWRSLSLRAKVTGVAVSILALGLIATGIGTTVFLRSQLLASVDTQVSDLAGAVGGLFAIDTSTGQVVVPDSPPTEYFVAIYDADGNYVAQAGGGRRDAKPDFPETFLPYADAFSLAQQPFDLSSESDTSTFRAAVAPVEITGTSIFYTQMV
ncbi:MAG: hypothetical protein VXY40_05985, partial [Actinomycetota bacterium]|nr:hypothetical protein [Actinomycetota bacterium]